MMKKNGREWCKKRVRFWDNAVAGSSALRSAMARKRGRLDYRDEADEVIRLYRCEREAWKKERLQTIKLLLETSKTKKYLKHYSAY